MRAFGLLRGAQTTADGLWQASRLLGPPLPAKSTSASGGPYRRSGGEQLGPTGEAAGRIRLRGQYGPTLGRREDFWSCQDQKSSRS